MDPRGSVSRVPNPLDAPLGTAAIDKDDTTDDALLITPVGTTGDDENDPDAEIEAAREEVERTREQIVETVDAIKDRLSPKTLMHEAQDAVQEVKETIQEAAKEKAQQTVENIKARAQDLLSTAQSTAKDAFSDAGSTASDTLSNAGDTAKDALSSAGEKAKDAGSAVAGTVKEHSWPLVLAGLGIGWTLLRLRKRDGDKHEPNLERSPDYPVPEAAHVLETPAYRPPTMSDYDAPRTLEPVPMAALPPGNEGGFVKMIEENPVMVGAMAVALGAALGYALRETSQEQRVIGETGGQIREMAQQTAQEVTQQAKSIAQEAIDTAKQEVKNMGLTG